MTEYLVMGGVVLLVVISLQLFMVLKRANSETPQITARLDDFEQAQERMERLVRDEMTRNRDEWNRTGREQRQELAEAFKGLSQSLSGLVDKAAEQQNAHFEGFSGRLDTFSRSSVNQFEAMRSESTNGARLLREEVVKLIGALSDAVTKSVAESAKLQEKQLEVFGGQLNAFIKASTEQQEELRADQATVAKALREEMVTTLERISNATTDALNTQLKHFAAQIAALSSGMGERLDSMRTESTNVAKLLREEVAVSLKGISSSLAETMGQISNLQKNQLEAMATAIDKLAQSVEVKLEAVRSTVDGKLKSMQEDNAKQIEQMRVTVDEKLQGTLEKRLSESFKHVSERLELVHKGLGEMQTLATGVGDLKKVLTNVKTRGTWGEVQLGALLEQVLTPEQYATNVSTNGGSERVEFAIKLPGQGDSRDQTVLLPLDAKFPVEDYQRLLEAQERADVEAVEAAGKQLEARVKQCARDIHAKYLNPPTTTDFGILFLPIEGLFAEVIRRPGLTDALQRDQRVVIAGPTTLWSILSSLQMGFRTLAIQKRSSEVWSLLGAFKTEWKKYSDVLDLVQKKLHQASETIDKAQVRTRAVSRRLRSVEALPAGEAAALLPFDVASGEDDAEDGDRVSSDV